eukprot:2091211-Amphidinium_carterae.2
MVAVTCYIGECAWWCVPHVLTLHIQMLSHEFFTNEPGRIAVRLASEVQRNAGSDWNTIESMQRLSLMLAKRNARSVCQVATPLWRFKLNKA